MNIIGSATSENVVGEGVFEVRRIEVDDIVEAVARHGSEDVHGQIPVGVHKAQTRSGLHILHDGVEEE